MQASIGVENTIMRFVNCLLDKHAQPDSSSKYFLTSGRVSETFNEVERLHLSVSNDRLKTKGNIIIHIRFSDLRTAVLFTVVENWAINVLLSTDFVLKPLKKAEITLNVNKSIFVTNDVD